LTLIITFGSNGYRYYGTEVDKNSINKVKVSHLD